MTKEKEYITILEDFEDKFDFQTLLKRKGLRQALNFLAGRQLPRGCAK